VGKIIKDSGSTNIQNHSFTVLKKGQKGTKSFEVKTFSTVEKGTKSFKFNKLESIVKKKKSDKILRKEEQQNELECSEKKEDIFNPTKEEIDALIKEKVEKARKIALDEGYKRGFEEAKATYEKKYEAEKEDYLKQIEIISEEALKEIQSLKDYIKKLDTEIPELVLRFVKEIVGQERKLNDEIVISLIKNNISSLYDFEEITFIVNPEDENIVRNFFSEYNIDTDVNILKGSFKVKTKLGEIDFSIDNLIHQLEFSINEKFRTS
jgi:flagellar assembly protein FliH